MTTRVMIQRAGEPPGALELAATVSLGSAQGGVHLPGVAPSAARLCPADDGMVLEAVTGVVLAGRALTPGVRVLVEPGQRVAIGPHLVWCEAAPVPEGTRAMAAALLAGAALPVDVPTLLALEGPEAGQRWEARDGAVIGRARGAAVRLSDPLVSRHHVALAVSASSTSADGRAGRNGLCVNGRRVRAARPLRHGDVLELGGTRLRYVLPAVAATPTPDAAPVDAAPAPESPTARRRWPAVAAALACALAACAAALAALAT